MSSFTVMDTFRNTTVFHIPIYIYTCTIVLVSVGDAVTLIALSLASSVCKVTMHRSLAVENEDEHERYVMYMYSLSNPRAPLLHD